MKKKNGPFRTVSIIISVEKYEAYHRQVVNACVALTKKSLRKFFNGCSWEEDFIKERNPEDVAAGEIEALEGSK